MEDERLVTADRLHLLGVGRVGNVVRRLGGRKVRRVPQARPFALLLIPPYVALALGPRPPLRVGRGAVVDDAAVFGPGPTPFIGDPVLLGAGLLAVCLVDAVLVDAAVDPR